MSRMKNNPLDQAGWIDKDDPNRPGRKISAERGTGETTREGLKDNWTRATFIVRADLLEKLKDLAWYNRTKIKDEITRALEEYLNDKEVPERSEYR